MRNSWITIPHEKMLGVTYNCIKKILQFSTIHQCLKIMTLYAFSILERKFENN